MKIFYKFRNNTSQLYFKFILKKVFIFTGTKFKQNVLIRVSRYLFYTNKLLFKKGLVKSIRKRNPILVNSLPIPWLTHPFIEYISKLNLRNLSMVEFGSGNSTIFFSKIVKDIESFEYNEDFIYYLQKKHNYQGVIHLVEENYASKIEDFKKDIIFIDGFNRNGIILNLLEYISFNKETPPTLIIIDNPDFINQDLLNNLLKFSYIRVDFYGTVSDLWNENITSLFISKDVSNYIFEELNDFSSSIFQGR